MTTLRSASQDAGDADPVGAQPEASADPVRPSARWDVDLVGLGLLALVVVVALVALPTEPKGAELYSQWLLGYDHGLVKRGLVGTVLLGTLFSSGGRISPDDMFAVSAGIALLSLASYVALGARVWISRRPGWRAGARRVTDDDVLATLLVLALLLASPIGLAYYVSNSQYLEQVNLLVLSVFAHVALSRPRRAVLVATAVACSVLSTLAHENALLSTVPVMLAGTAYRCGGLRAGRRTLAVLGTTGVACLALVVVAGATTSQVAAEVVRDAEARYPTEVADRTETGLVLTRSVPDNIAYTFDKYSSLSGGGSRIPLSLLVTAPAMAFLAMLIRRRDPSAAGLLLVVAALAPCALVLLGDDVYRWFVLAVVGLAVLVLAIAPTGAAPDPAGRARRPGGLVALGVLALLAATALPYPYFLDNDGNPMSDQLLRVLSGLESLVP